jgi:hypothetical protein
MKFAHTYSIPATPFNTHAVQPTPDTIMVAGREIRVQKFPEGLAADIDVVCEGELTSDKGNGPDADEWGGLNDDYLYEGDTMNRATPFGNRKSW